MSLSKILAFLGLLCFMVVSFSTQAQHRIILQNDQNIRLFEHLDDALMDMLDGDTLYLPGGMFSASGDILFTKSNITIIGAGSYPEYSTATQRTILNDVVRLQGNGITLMGVRVQGEVYVEGNNCKVERCYLRHESYIGIYISGTNTIVKHNIIGEIGGNADASVLFEGNIIQYRATSLSHPDVVFRYNIFLNTCCSLSFINNASFEKNIFNHDMNFSNSSDNVFTDNAFRIENPIPNCISGSNEYCNSYVLPEFVGGELLYDFSYDFDYHLVDDMLDLGIYKGGFKEGAVPFNPHIISAIIPEQTDENGNLNISIQVEAQSH